VHSLEREKLLLMAAYLHPQRFPDRLAANSWRVLRQAMLWGGALDEAAEALHGQGDHPVVNEWYRALIDLGGDQSESNRLLWVGGNTELPAWPAFTGCGLTEKGRIAAERLFTEHPQDRV